MALQETNSKLSLFFGCQQKCLCVAPVARPVSRSHGYHFNSGLSERTFAVYFHSSFSYPIFGKSPLPQCGMHPLMYVGHSSSN